MTDNSEKKEWLVIVNPNAGNAKGVTRLGQIAEYQHWVLDAVWRNRRKRRFPGTFRSKTERGTPTINILATLKINASPIRSVYFFLRQLRA